MSSASMASMTSGSSTGSDTASSHRAPHVRADGAMMGAGRDRYAGAAVPAGGDLWPVDVAVAWGGWWW